jgi:nucleotide-binding universal stress UspA family protein
MECRSVINRLKVQGKILLEIAMLSFKNILYAIDLDENKSTSILLAMEFAQMFQSRLHIVYVNDPQAGYRHPTDREDAIALKVHSVVPEILLSDIEVIYASVKGNVAEEIIRYAEEQKIDLIIAGHKHRSKLYSSLFDSTDVNIIDTALKTPVLVIPEI